MQIVQQILRQNLNTNTQLRTRKTTNQRENKTPIVLMKDELGGEVMKEFVALRSKIYIYANKKSKGYKEERNKTKI